jgi:hypothetical protein
MGVHPGGRERDEELLMAYPRDSCDEPAGPFTADPQHPCAPGNIDTPICYTIPPGETVYNGFKRITLLADCTASATQILDESLAPVPGAVETGCNPLAPNSCCDPASLCTILQGTGLGVPGVADTALFVTPAGCFLGVPGGGGGGFPGYGVPVTTACANSPGVSLLAARADHVHRSEVPVQDEGVAVGSRCSINFIGSGVATVDNPGLDRVDVTIGSFGGGTIIAPIEAASGSCAAPSYSFTASPDSGMFYTGTAVRISDDNCDDFIEVGASVSIATASVVRHTYTNTGEWLIGGSVGAAGEVITSNGAALAPTWQAVPAGSSPAVLFAGAQSVGLATDTRDVPWGYDDTVNANAKEMHAPRAGTIRNLYVRHNLANGNGNTVVYTLFVNGVATALSATLATGAVGFATDLVDSVAVAAGDRLVVRRVIAVGIGNATLECMISMEFI